MEVGVDVDVGRLGRYQHSGDVVCPVRLGREERRGVLSSNEHARSVQN